MTKSALLVVNRRARAGAKALDPVVTRLADAGIRCDVARPETVEEAGRIVREKGPTSDLIVVGGGDGTVSGLLDALLAARRPIGLLPLGTANDLARTLALPVDPLAAAAVITGGATRNIDVGLIDDRPFINVAHLGLGTQVAREHERDRAAKRRFGALAYPLHWYRAYRNSRPVRVEIVANGEKHSRLCAQLAIGAGVHYGSGLRVSDDAAPDDGLLHLHAVGPRSILKWLGLLVRLKFGRLRTAPDATVLSARTIKVQAARRVLIDIDGEVGPFRSGTFKVLPGALTFFVPGGVSYAAAKPESGAGAGPP